MSRAAATTCSALSALGGLIGTFFVIHGAGAGDDVLAIVGGAAIVCGAASAVLFDSLSR